MPTHTHTHVCTLTHGWNVWYGDVGKGMETSTRIKTRTGMYYTRIDTLHNTIDTTVLIHNILNGDYTSLYSGGDYMMFCIERVKWSE